MTDSVKTVRLVIGFIVSNLMLVPYYVNFGFTYAAFFIVGFVAFWFSFLIRLSSSDYKRDTRLMRTMGPYWPVFELFIYAILGGVLKAFYLKTIGNQATDTIYYLIDIMSFVPIYILFNKLLGIKAKSFLYFFIGYIILSKVNEKILLSPSNIGDYIALVW